MADYQVVQFVHPGFEYHGQKNLGTARASGVMSWKPGKTTHDRKFMLTRGAALDYSTGEFHDSTAMTFWGEWEGPSVFWKMESPGKPLARTLHAPFRPADPPEGSVQNTDPLVFGDAFVYSNCLQNAFPTLRQLAPGSIVLFGRYGRPGGVVEFTLDTCLVVDRAEPLTTHPFDQVSYGEDLVDDAVACPLFTEGATDDFILYWGRTPEEGTTIPFSFFPAGLMREMPALFPRPQLRPTGALEGVVTSGKMQGIKVTSGLGARELHAVWTEVARQVAVQRCLLGYFASPPPLLNRVMAESASERGPTPLTA